MHPIVHALSIHTVEIRIYTNKESYDYMRDIVREKYKLYYVRDYVRDDNYDYQNNRDNQIDVYKSTRNNYINGINTIILRRYKTKDDIMLSYVSIVFNLNTILRGADSLDPYLTIIHPSQIPEAMSRVWDFADNLNIYKQEVKIKRIDFSINLEFMSHKEAVTFLDLCQKAKWNHHLKDYTEYNEIAHRNMPKYKGSILKRCNSYEIAIYSKSQQMENSMRLYSIDEMRRSSNVIRMELRIEREIIRKILNSYKCTEQDLLMKEEYYKKLIKIYAEKLIKLMRNTLGYGKFYSYSECIAEIDKIHELRLITANKKDKLTSMIRDASIHRGFYWLYSEDSPYNQNAIRDLKKTLNKHGISHITIPNNSDITMITNPFTYFERDAEKCIYGWDRYND